MCVSTFFVSYKTTPSNKRSTFDISYDINTSPPSYHLFSFSFSFLSITRYFRQPYQSTNGLNYDDSVYLMDVDTQRWQRLAALPWPDTLRQADQSSGKTAPPGRYLSGMVFVSMNSFSWKRTWNYRALFDQLLGSTHANFLGSMSDSLLIYGGFNGATGSMEDGSSGG